MCLLSLLLSWREKLQLRLTVVHINHGIRGEAADADEHFVEEFCRRHGVEFEAVHADIPALARESGRTEEETGRMFRYETFFRICREKNYNKIAVAHNSDDNAETVLFNLCRGSGIAGARGISRVRVENGITVIRPLLECTRSEIEEYLAAKGLDFCTDETNLGTEYSRNRIRNIILPMIRTNINPAASKHITEFAAQAGEIEDYIGRQTEDVLAKACEAGRIIFAGDRDKAEGIVIDAEFLTGTEHVIRTALLRKLLGQLAGSLKDIESRHIRELEALVGAGVGKKADLPYAITARRGYTALELKRETKSVSEHGTAAGNLHGSPVRELAVNTGPGGPLAVNSCRIAEFTPMDSVKDCGGLSFELKNYENTFSIPKNDYAKVFDYGKIDGNIILRTRRPGDYLNIRSARDGMLHRKSLKSWFIDNKIPEPDRAAVPLLCVDDHVLWVIGYRADDAYPVTDTTTVVLSAGLTP